MASLESHKRTTELLDVIFDSSPDLLAIADFKGFFLRVNPSWQRVLGWTREELLAHPFSDFVHPDDLDSTADEYGTTIDEAQGSSAFENRYRTKSGGYRWLQWNSHPLPDRGIIVANARDVTAQKERSFELMRSNDDLANFAAIVSHDLKAPAATVMGYAEILEQRLAGIEDRDIDACVAAIGRGAKRMAELTDGILNYSHAGVPERSSATDVDLNAIVDDVVNDLSVLVQARDGQIDVGALPCVSGDAIQLRQVIQNILANSLKFGRNGIPLVIEVDAARSADEWTVSIKDNGIGITVNDSEKAFEPFCQGEGAVGRGGIGLGLATCQRLVDRHGGHIEIAPRADRRGTTVTFTIPTAGPPRSAMLESLDSNGSVVA